MAHVRMITPRRKNDPDRFGAFRVIGRLGGGGFGNVYVAGRRGRTGELVAVKVMHPPLAGNAQFRFRFGQEIQAIERVDSEYVPGLKGHDADDEAVWLATELVRGPSLQQVVERSGPLPERTIWPLALDMATALCDIHGAGLVHRDLKPGNVLLVAQGPRIIDFGLAHLMEADHRTASGLPLCSPEYAPPEQRRRLRDADKAADIFTLGGTLLFAATGHAPYGAEWDPLPAAPNLAGLPNALGDVISHCLYHDERARPPLAELVAYFAFRAETAAGHDDPAFASVLTAGITKVINGWRRELDQVIRNAGPGPAGAGLWDESGPARPPAPGMRATAPYPPHPGAPDAPGRTAMFPRDRDDGRLTLPEPGIAASPFGDRRDDLRWKVQLGDWVRAPVTVTRDMAVAATLGGVVSCFDVHSGRVLGQANLGAPVRSAVLLPGGPHAGLAYAGADDGVVYQIDLASGRYRPLLYASGAIEGPPVAVGGRIYALSADGCVYEADARASGEAALLCDLGVPALGTLTVADGTVIATSAEGCVYAIGTAERAVRWQLPTSGLVFGAPAAVAGWLYLAGTDGQLWSARVDDRRRRAMLDIGAPVHTAPVHDRGRLYVAGGDGRVRAFDISGRCAATPTLLWASGEIGGEVSGIAALGGTVVVAAGRTLTALDGSSGEPAGSSSPGTLMTAAPVMNNDLVYVAGLDGTVSCLSMAGWGDSMDGRGDSMDGRGDSMAGRGSRRAAGIR